MNRREFIRTLGIIPFGFSVQWDKMGKEINGLSSSVKRKHKLSNSYAREIETFHILKSQWDVIWEGSHYALWKFIKDEFSYEIPSSPVCKDHIDPLHFLADAFFEDKNLESTILIEGNQGGGMTFLLIMLNHLNCLFKSDFSACHIGRFKGEAQRAYSYLLNLFKSSVSQNRLVFNSRKLTRYTTGSTIQIRHAYNDENAILPSNCVILDGAYHIGEDVLREFLSIPETHKGHKPIRILVKPRNLKINLPISTTFSWCVFETIKRCTLPSCDQCKRIIRMRDLTPIIDGPRKEESWYDICHEDIERHPYGKCRAADGFIPLDDVWNKFMYLDWDVFDKMYRCL